MTQVFSGKLYSGTESSSCDVTLQVDAAGMLTVTGADIPSQHVSDILISQRIGNSARYLILQSGARIETWANKEVDALQAQWGNPNAGIAHRLENSKAVILVAVTVLVVGMYAFVTFGIPALSATITSMLPTALDDQLGSEVLQRLDGFAFSPSSLPSARQDELSDLFDSLVPNDERNYQITYRDSELLGANAFALPNAQIVFTDDLVALSDDDAMMAAIMLHEIGHVVQRHSMQAVVRQAGISMLIFTFMGDVNGAATALIVLLPTFLIQSQYARDLEWDADSYALEQMLARGIDTNAFADIMERLVGAGEEEAKGSALEEDPMFEYFSTHPATRARVERFRRD